jgi:hypothetical protein
VARFDVHRDELFPGKSLQVDPQQLWLIFCSVRPLALFEKF